MNSILAKLGGGDRRSIGKVDKVVAEVLANRRLFRELFKGMSSDEPLIRMRAADAVEKITSLHPEWLRPFKFQLISKISRIEQQEVRWHAAQMFARIELTANERKTVLKILESYLDDTSKIVKTFAMQAMADLAGQDPKLRARIIKRLEYLTRTGSPAMKSRGRKLLAQLKRV